MSLYVEIAIRAPLDEVWIRTQDPALHEQWDARFTRIEYLPGPDPKEPQRFRYATRIGFGRFIEGTGESVGQVDGSSGERTSALRFGSDDPRSLIREGSGYWRYAPLTGAVRFLTDYDYTTRGGAMGRVIDRLLFRPLLHRATAWSFDRLRLWIERGIAPAVLLRIAVLHWIARAAAAFVFAWHGLVPKLIARDPDEARMLVDLGIEPARAAQLALLGGWIEIAWAILLLWQGRHRALWIVTIGLMVLATTSVAIGSPDLVGRAFNPVSLNASVAALAAIAAATATLTPSSSRCLLRPPRP